MRAALLTRATLVLLGTGFAVVAVMIVLVAIGTSGTRAFHWPPTAMSSVAPPGREILFWVAGSSFALLAVLLLVTRLFLSRMILAPLAHVERHLDMVRTSGVLAELDCGSRHDEIGAVVKAMNTLVREQYRRQDQVQARSFSVGRADLAGAVVHNVRNALNPIGTILSQGLTQRPPIEPVMVERALTELARDDISPARRQKLLQFLQTAVHAGTRFYEDRQAALQVGREAMTQVLDIIGQQQMLVHERPHPGHCDVVDIVARNATIARYSSDVSVVFSLPAASFPVVADSVILSQIIGNLFSNAVEAIAARGRAHGAIMVSCARENGAVLLRVQDDGEGFEPADAPILFQRGYSTRRQRCGGLGLHWCANSMMAMNGSLRLESEGRGRGAVAILTLQAADTVAQGMLQAAA